MHHLTCVRDNGLTSVGRQVPRGVWSIRAPHPFCNSGARSTDDPLGNRTQCGTSTPATCVRKRIPSARALQGACSAGTTWTYAPHATPFRRAGGFARAPTLIYHLPRFGGLSPGLKSEGGVARRLHSAISVPSEPEGAGRRNPMKRFGFAVLTLVVAAGFLAGCCGFDPCNPCGDCCDTGCSAPASPCGAPATSCGSCGGGAAAPAAPADAGAASCGGSGSCG